jgi:hypothetical protein
VILPPLVFPGQSIKKVLLNWSVAAVLNDNYVQKVKDAEGSMTFHRQTFHLLTFHANISNIDSPKTKTLPTIHLQTFCL